MSACSPAPLLVQVPTPAGARRQFGVVVTHLAYTLVIPDLAAWSTAYSTAPEDGGDRTEEQYWPQHTPFSST